MGQKITIDLTGETALPPRERYSDEVLRRAGEATSLARVENLSGSNTFYLVRSLSGSGVYRVRPVYGADGDLIGCTCTCPNGKNSPIAHCYHAAAVEMRPGEAS